MTKCRDFCNERLSVYVCVCLAEEVETTRLWLMVREEEREGAKEIEGPGDGKLSN